MRENALKANLDEIEEREKGLRLRGKSTYGF